MAAHIPFRKADIRDERIMQTQQRLRNNQLRRANGEAAHDQSLDPTSVGQGREQGTSSTVSDWIAAKLAGMGDNRSMYALAALSGFVYEAILSQMRTSSDPRADEIRTLAVRVFGDRTKAERWLNRPNRATDNRAPIALAATAEGFERVSNLLVRIDHGVLA